MRGAGIASALAKYMACPVYSSDEEWTPGGYMECESCPLSEPFPNLTETFTICEAFAKIDEEETDESEFA